MVVGHNLTATFLESWSSRVNRISGISFQYPLVSLYFSNADGLNGTSCISWYEVISELKITEKWWILMYSKAKLIEGKSNLLTSDSSEVSHRS